MKTQSEIKFENIYDKYSPIVYGIALEISPTTEIAEQILFRIFQEVYTQNLFEQNHPSLCVTLIKLVFQIAHEQLPHSQVKNNFKLNQFENTLILHKLLCEQLNLEVYCKNNKLTRVEIAKKIREEFIFLRKIKKENGQLVENIFV